MRIRKRLGELLVEGGLLTDEQLKDALAQHKKSGMKLGKFLVQRGIVREDAMIDAVASQLKIDRYRADKYPVNAELTNVIPMDMAQRHQLVPLAKKPHLLTVGMTDPMDIESLDAIEIYTNTEVEAVICTERELTQLISSLYGFSSLADGMEEVQGLEMGPESQVQEEAADTEIEVQSLAGMVDEAPVVRLVNSILSQAIREGASDVHIGPEKTYAHVRFRIDGKLHEVPAPPKSLLMPVISRIKILSNMDIATTRIPQDGRFTLKMESREINVRASTVPTIYGENLVLRLLDMSSGIYSLHELGMNKDDRAKIESVIVKPYGMILSTGPTGSGKSTSLYAILQALNKPDINIITVEDPVEYRLEKIKQIQLNRKAGMTFASGLRAILRQDPDVIMVGEIRDGETASIAVQAALTGHRVLSTLHTNDSAGAVTRLVDMGIEPFLVSSVLLVSFAQRLVRTVCTGCQESYIPADESLAAWGLSRADVAGVDFKRGKGCAMCMQTGYKGRTGIFEVLKNDDTIQDLISRRDSSQEIARSARAAGKMRFLREDALDKVFAGRTTLEEAASAVMT
ncbi:type II secretion system protein E (GspE) [Desulfatibacillum alkenivorans DSM 16219]|jgi:type IV pilus assembly protein PilB|uniref:Type II secretion system protein E (GspE) n=1 Tax=Desulfatibacillum alkenivorans DSM 16219 TaxID=1121393 RepID=A0A1M6NXB3_9BACT|nr:GspE/PulE family protein [Desulfatibacillum alkenivorans]SHK00264.1 type II secretion system protein E (GspE) [Desulfatibacillum alkenivorans DSM 16219]